MRKRYLFILGMMVLLAVLAAPAAAGAGQPQAIDLNRDYQGSFTKGGESACYLFTLPRDGLIRLEARSDGRMDVSMYVAGIKSGDIYQEGVFVSGTGYSSDGSGFGGSLGLRVGPYRSMPSDNLVFTLAAGTYKFIVSNWGCDKGGTYGFNIRYTPAQWPDDPEPNDTAGQAREISFGNWNTGHLDYNGLSEQNKAEDKSDYYQFSLPADSTLTLEYGDDDYLGARFTIIGQDGSTAHGEMINDQTGQPEGSARLVFSTPIANEAFKYIPPERRSNSVGSAKFKLKAGVYRLSVTELKNIGGEYRFRIGRDAESPPPAVKPPAPVDSGRKGGGIAIRVDNIEIQPDVPPQIINGRTMVPIRFVAQALNCQVDWEGTTRTVIITSPGAYKAAPPANYSGQIQILVNGRLIYPDVPPQLVDGRTLVPVRFVAEALGASVNWDGASQTVIIGSSSGPAAQNTPPAQQDMGDGTVVNAPVVGMYIDQDTQRLLEKRVDASGRTIYVFTDRSQPVYADAPAIYASVLLENAAAGQQIRATLEYNNGQASIVSDALTLPRGGSGFIGFSFTRDTGTWPRGNYQVKIYLNNISKARTSFAVE